ncbi:MAG: GGDEF domain-containing protein [Pseudohongiella sp.]|nr:GGDEF domain-containing protein [Pseudohongiella sp.]MDP2126597.1 GGDEF domain-containing protein [Pseudohongiella sp.]
MRPDCPRCEPGCKVLEELEQLRLRVDELSTQLLTDALTGLYNYRHLLWALGQEIERVRRSGGEFSLLVIDFDNFKLLNDTYGHEFGNQVLRAAGVFFKSSLRKLDVPCRFGGEEFVIVLPGTELREAVHLAERLRDGVAGLQLMYGDSSVPVTISTGVDTFRAGEQLTVEMLLDRADQHLLQAKKSGKNKVCYPDSSEYPDGMSVEEKTALMDSFKDLRN